ncbi:MAG: polysaccharide deacetylase family protein [Caulobacterales bacterium]|uniref:polysaccharide deacetylase family protein n=1 Tax=Glycocaulis sp. TaxID=1969725 RepID=UPI003F9EED45
MTLPSSYLEYPRRGHGQDMDRHDWQLAKDRAPVRLANGKALAVMIVVNCEFHPINPANSPFRHPAGMVTPWPDLRHFTSRDYGNRVGVFRILDALKQAGLKATFPVSADLIARARPLVDAIAEGGHEIAAAGLNGDAIHWSGLERDEENRRIEAVRRAFDGAGLNPVSWMSPARQQSFATPDLLTAHGFTRTLDWETDQVPVALRTESGPLTALPVHNELEDFKLLIERHQSEALWRDQIIEAKDFLIAESAARGAGVLGFTLTPFVAGQPFRVWALREMLVALAGDEQVWCGRADEIAQAFSQAAP